MRNLIERIAFSSIGVLWLVAVVSIPIIPEKCVVCGHRQGANHAETLRNRTVIEWLLDDVPDLHFTCAPNYDAEIHNPNGGIK